MPRENHAKPPGARNGEDVGHLGQYRRSPFIWLTMPTCMSVPDQVRPWFLRDSSGFEIVPELAPRDDEAVLDKIAFSAFEGTPLATILRDCGLISFAIVGIATEIGIDPTIRHGADLGFIPVMVQDACGAGHAEAGQWSVSALTFMGDAILTDVAAFAAAVAAEDGNRSELKLLLLGERRSFWLNLYTAEAIKTRRTIARLSLGQEN